MNSDSEDEMKIDRTKLMHQKKQENILKEMKSELENSNKATDKEKKMKKRVKKDNREGKQKIDSSKEKLDNHLKSQEFVTQMRDIVISDNENNKANKAATNKLSNLDLMYKTCLNKKLQASLIENDILSVIKMWLEPLPDKSLPNILIRKILLQLLLNMKITIQDLRNSEIGKIIHFYTLNPNECNEVKKVANFLMQKWSKIVVLGENRED